MRVVLDRPSLVLFAVGAVYEHGVAGVDIAGDVGVAAGAEDRGGAGVGIDAGKVVRRQREAAVRSSAMALVSWRKKAHAVSSNRRSAPPTDEGAELETRVHVGEERRQIGTEATILESHTARPRGRGWKRT